MSIKATTLSSIIVTLSMLFAASTTLAQSLWSSEVELGAVFTSGNTDEQNIKFRGQAARDSEQWQHKVYLDTLNSSKMTSKALKNPTCSTREITNCKLAHCLGERPTRTTSLTVMITRLNLPLVTRVLCTIMGLTN